jgi:hypothetical protein
MYLKETNFPNIPERKKFRFCIFFKKNSKSKNNCSMTCKISSRMFVWHLKLIFFWYFSIEKKKKISYLTRSKKSEPNPFAKLVKLFFFLFCFFFNFFLLFVWKRTRLVPTRFRDLHRLNKLLYNVLNILYL